jgi:hypothetical protein
MEGHQFDPGQYAFTAQHNPFMTPSVSHTGSHMPQGSQGNTGLEYPMEGIDYPGLNDVMCGRGTLSDTPLKLSMEHLIPTSP